jgi:hypothetical protein
MIFLGIPKLQTQNLKNNSEHSNALLSALIGINILYLENLSIIENIESNPRAVKGKCVIKSIVTCSKGLLGFYTGCNKPKGF